MRVSALESNLTWSLVPLPANKCPIGCKWVYKVKRNSNGSIEHFKALLVAKGYLKKSICYLRLVMSVKGRTLFANCINCYTDTSRLLGNGLDANEISKLKSSLHKRFKLKDLGNLKYFLGIEVSRSKKGICLNQCEYALDIIKDTCLLGAKPETFPMEENLRSNNTDGNLLNNPTSYHRLIGRLIYLTVTRHGILFAINILSQFMHQPCQPHMKAATRLVHYLKGSPGQDWASCPMTRRSTTGYCVFLGTSLISWKTKKSLLSLDLLQKSSIGLWKLLLMSYNG
ncbi:unnamed protein product [Prunus armeniaca]